MRDVVYFIFLRNQNPLLITVLVPTKYPKCGVPSVTSEYILCWYRSRCGRAALTIMPPMECATKEIFLKFSLGQCSRTQSLSSMANRYPISAISSSLRTPSLHCGEKTKTSLSQPLNLIASFQSLRSQLLPLKPCTKTYK